jgi:hypothetical protein
MVTHTTRPAAHAAAAPQPAEPRAAPTPSTPTPTPHEINTFLTQQATNSQPRPSWSLAMDGSPIDPKSFDPTPKTTSFP